MQLALSNGYLLQTHKTSFPVAHTDPQTDDFSSVLSDLSLCMLLLTMPFSNDSTLLAVLSLIPLSQIFLRHLFLFAP